MAWARTTWRVVGGACSAPLVVCLVSGAVADAAGARSRALVHVDAPSALPGQVVRLTGPGVAVRGATVTIGGRRASVVARDRRRLSVLVPKLGERVQRVVVRTGTSRLAGRLRVRASPPTRVQPVLEPLLASTVTIGRSGGVVRARGSDGTAYELAVPPGALERATAITMTPVKRLAGSSFDGTTGAVQFAPDGLALARQATLRVTRASPRKGRTVGLSYRGSGHGLALRRAERQGAALTLGVEHFSGVGPAGATLANFMVVLTRLAAKPQLTVEDANDFFDTLLAADTVFGRGWCLGDATCRYTRQRALDVFQRDVTGACRDLVPLASTIRPLQELIRRLQLQEAVAQDEGRSTLAEEACKEKITRHMVTLVDRAAREDPLGVSGACADALGDADGDGHTRSVECALAVAQVAGLQGFLSLQSDAQEAALAGFHRVLDVNQPRCDSPGTFADALRQLLLGAATDSPSRLLTAEWDTALEYCVKITITPPAASVEVGTTADFAAAGKDPSDGSFSWSSSRIDAPVDAAGHFTAPARPGPVTVTAASTAHPERVGRAVVTVTCPAGKVEFQGTCAVIGISIDPTAITLAPGESHRFTATVTNTSDTRATWSASGGSISQPTTTDPGGLYKAPQTPGDYTVTAASLRDPTKQAAATVTVAGAAVRVNTRSPVAIRACGDITARPGALPLAGLWSDGAAAPCNGGNTTASQTSDVEASATGASWLTFQANVSATGMAGSSSSYHFVNFSVLGTSAVTLTCTGGFTTNASGSNTGEFYMSFNSAPLVDKLTSGAVNVSRLLTAPGGGGTLAVSLDAGANDGGSVSAAANVTCDFDGPVTVGP